MRPDGRPRFFFRNRAGLAALAIGLALVIANAPFRAARSAPAAGSPGVIATIYVTPGACHVICEQVPFCKEIADMDRKTAACRLRLDTAHPAFEELAASCPGALQGKLKEHFVKGPRDPETGMKGHWTLVCAR